MNMDRLRRVGEWSARSTNEDFAMLDVILVGTAILLFGLMVAYAIACDRV